MGSASQNPCSGGVSWKQPDGPLISADYQNAIAKADNKKRGVLDYKRSYQPYIRSLFVYLKVVVNMRDRYMAYVPEYCFQFIVSIEKPLPCSVCEQTVRTHSRSALAKSCSTQAEAAFQRH